jgi:hypothetical protein
MRAGARIPAAWLAFGVLDEPGSLAVCFVLLHSLILLACVSADQAHWGRRGLEVRASEIAGTLVLLLSCEDRKVDER